VLEIDILLKDCCEDEFCWMSEPRDGKDMLQCIPQFPEK
jgi:hypothetical protein